MPLQRHIMPTIMRRLCFSTLSGEQGSGGLRESLSSVMMAGSSGHWVLPRGKKSSRMLRNGNCHSVRTPPTRRITTRGTSSAIVSCLLFARRSTLRLLRNCCGRRSCSGTSMCISGPRPKPSWRILAYVVKPRNGILQLGDFRNFQNSCNSMS